MMSKHIYDTIASLHKYTIDKLCGITPLQQVSGISVTLPLNDYDSFQVLLKYGFTKYYIDLSIRDDSDGVAYDCRVISESTKSYIAEYEFDHKGMLILDAVSKAVSWIKKQLKEDVNE